MSTASEITRKAKSNLAFALHILPRERRDDMVVFYAFCRTMDDLADAPGISTAERRKSLNAWETGLTHGFDFPDAFQQEVIALRDREQLPTETLVAILDGCRSDLEPQRFEKWQDLSAYIWKVACAVGLISTRLFGCQNPAADRYAVALGHALQLTNILRDIAEDFANDQRLYLPLEDLAHFGYTEQDLLDQVTDERFLALMTYQADRADRFYQEAADTLASLPELDRAALLPAEIMSEIYQLLLTRMRADHFEIFKKRYRISKPHKLAIFTKHLMRSPN
jgi:15-cis-phytoene synthase